MKTTSLSHMIGTHSDAHRASVVFLVLVAVLGLGSCGGKKDGNTPAADADTTRRNPEVVDGTATPDTPAPVDTLDAPDSGEVATDFQGQDKVGADAPGPDGEVVQPPSLFPYKLAATYVLEDGNKKLLRPRDVAVGANGKLLCVDSSWPDEHRSVLCYRVGLPGANLAPVDTSNLDAVLTTFEKSAIVSMALPINSNHIYILLEDSTSNNQLIVAGFDYTKNQISHATAFASSDLQGDSSFNLVDIYHPTATNDGAFLYTNSHEGLTVISIPQTGNPTALQRIPLDGIYNWPQLTLNSNETWIVAAWADSACVGQWWVFDRDPVGGTLALLTQQQFSGDCSLTFEDMCGSTIGPAREANRILFAGSDLADKVALGLAHIAPGSEAPVSLAGNLLPFGPGTNSLATLPSLGLAALYLNSDAPPGPGLAVAQTDSKTGGVAESQFIPEASFDKDMELYCGLCETGVTRTEAFSLDGTRLFLACSSLDDLEPGWLFVFEASE